METGITAWPGWNYLPVIHFLVISAALIGGALAVVTLRNLVHAALWLIVTFGATAALFILLNAEFLAFAQVLIYMGGISILILFAIMLSRKIVGLDLVMNNRQSIPAALVCLLLASFLAMPGIGVLETMDLDPEPTLVVRAENLTPQLRALGVTEEYLATLPDQTLITTNWYAPNTAVLGQS
ncbi:MAG TPA: NADH-quinone oxidoreductase subunit J, partial [bacterium]|nr:NADH-quinone oxidoreductase subunit J [bacterium]